MVFYYLFQLFQQFCQLFKVAGIYFHVEQVSVAIEELVGGPAMDIEMALDGGLLSIGQVVVCHIRSADVVLLDDVLPCRLRALLLISFPFILLP